MKTIIKYENSLSSLEKAKKDKLTWEEFSFGRKEEYLEVREKATTEQDSECAYTGLWLGEGSRFKNHLDHFHLRSIYPKERFDWKNLFAAAHELSFGSDSKDGKIKGPKKNADKQYKIFWSPLEPNLQEKFWYTTSGEIQPSPILDEEGKKIALNTIEIYNLNHDILKQERRNIIEALISAKENGYLLEEIKESFSTAGFSFVVDFELKLLN